MLIVKISREVNVEDIADTGEGRGNMWDAVHPVSKGKHIQHCQRDKRGDIYCTVAEGKGKDACGCI